MDLFLPLDGDGGKSINQKKERKNIMEIKMKPQEIVNAMEGLLKVIKSEEEYCKAKAAAKFPPLVAMAIAKNIKKLENELAIVQEQQKKNQGIAEKRNVDLKDVQEQKELLKAEISIDIHEVEENNLLESKDLSSSDFCNLLFMVKQ